MNAAYALPSALAQIDLRDGARRAAPLAAALVLHAALLWAMVTLPPVPLVTVHTVIPSLDVRFYTVTSEDAETDARLVEPPIADDLPDFEASPAPVLLDEAESNDQQADQPEPVDEPPVAIDPLNDPATEPLGASTPGSGAPPSQTGSEGAGAAQPTQRPPPPPPDAQTLRAQRSGPVATTQIPARPRGENTLPRPSFASVLARVETRLDPDDFRVVLALDGVRNTVQESFCLSSSAANLEAGECPEGPNAASAELARYGLQALGEASPEFIEDLDRMEFELAQLGANPSQVQRIMVALRNARREAIETPGVLRAMERDAAGRTNNLGVGDSVTPARARDPSGEP